MSKKPAHLLLATALTLGVFATATTSAIAQPADNADRVVVDDDDNDFDYGWIGLLGLLGLAGLKRREVHTTHTTHTNNPNIR